MRILVNELQMLKQRTGIGHYTAELLRCLRAQAGSDRIDGFPGGWVRRATSGFFQAGTRVAQGSPTAAAPGWLSRLKRRAFGLVRDGWQAYLERRFAQVCRQGQYDLYHEPNYLPMPADCPTLATFHDLSVLLHPQWHPADRVARFEKQLPHVVARCRHFLTDSEAVRREVIQHLGVPADRVTRVYMGIRPDLQPLPRVDVVRGLARLGLPGNYLMILGTIEPRKNVLRLLKVYCSLPEAVRTSAPLVLVGGWGWNTAEVRSYLDDVARSHGVIHLGYVDDADLPILYNGARALIFPSCYEGFGLPPLEMLACGGAVIASTATTVHELLADKVPLIDPEDDDGWRTALTRIITQDDWWWSLRRRAVDIARPFTWDRCAAETFDVYRRLCGVALPVIAPIRRAAG